MYTESNENNKVLIDKFHTLYNSMAQNINTDNRIS